MEPISKELANEIATRMGLPAGPLSHTQIDSYLHCPREYYYRYVVKLPRKGINPKLTIGGIAHVGLESVARDKMSKTKPSVERAHDAMLRAYRVVLVKEGKDLDARARTALDAQFNSCSDIVEFFVNDELPEINPTCVEQNLTVLIAGIPITMKIDLIHDNKRVIDHKITGRAKSEADAKNSLQLSIYAIATGLKEVGFISHKFPDLTTKKRWAPFITKNVVQKNPGDLRWAEEVVAGISKAILAKTFPHCDPGDWKCSVTNCDCWGVCRGKIQSELALPETQEPGWLRGITSRWTDL